MYRTVIAAGLALSLAACGTTVQTSSGADYLERGQLVSGAGGSAEAALTAAASVEPLLRFPAKIGIARIEQGRLTGIPDAEMAAFAAMAEEAGGAYGTFAPVSPLIVAMVTPAENDRFPRREPGEVVRDIRLGAARQHMDAVLVYEVYGTADSRQNPLSVGDLTIVGAFLLPSRKVEAVGHAEALMFDVRNGYPYLTGAHTVDRSSLAVAARAYGRGEELEAEAELAAVEGLAGELRGAFAELAVELGNLDRSRLSEVEAEQVPVVEDRQ